MENKIIVLGSANVDLVIHSEKMPKLGETLVGSDFQVNAGGKGLNQAIAIAKLGGTVSFLGALGNDSNGEFLHSTLKEYDIPFEGIRSQTNPTGTAMITVVQGDNFILLNGGANHEVTPQMAEEKAKLIENCDFCVMQLEIPQETVIKVCQMAKNSDTKVVLNPAPFKELPREVYPLVDYLIPNEHEAEALTGISVQDEESATKALETIRSFGVETVIITLGDKGCVYNDGEEIRFHPAQSTSVVDTTSAGDCFIGALVTKLSQKEPLSHAIHYATKAAAMAVGRAGAAKSIPFGWEVE